MCANHWHKHYNCIHWPLLYNTLPQAQWPKTTCFYYPPVSMAQESRHGSTGLFASGSYQAAILLGLNRSHIKILRENSFPSSLSWLVEFLSMHLDS